MKLKIFIILSLVPVLWADENLHSYLGEKYKISVPNGFKIISATQGKHDASLDGVPFFIAQNEKQHLILGYFESHRIVRPEAIPLIAVVLKKQTPTPTARIVKTGMWKGGLDWAVAESDDIKAATPLTEHVILLITSIDNCLLRVIIEGPHGDAASLVDEATEFMAKFGKPAKPTQPDHSSEPTKDAVH